MFQFEAHAEATFEAAHSNGPVGHRCRTMHGHSWRVEFIWRYTQEDLNEYGWGPDFGSVKALIRQFDHVDLNEALTFAPSAENIAMHLLLMFRSNFPLIEQVQCTVYEGSGNSIMVRGS